MSKLITLIFLLLITTGIHSLKFEYKWDEGYRIESIVYQNVKLNREILLSSTILNKYAVEILNISEESAQLEVTQSVFQESKGLTEYYTHADSIKGEISQDKLGIITTITSINFPSVQNIPNFPDRDIAVGETWQAMAYEHFDLKNGFNIDDTVSTTFRVFYTYLGNEIIDNKEFAVIQMSYNFFEKISPFKDWGEFYPLKLNGGSKQTLLWDIEKGRAHSVKDKFYLEFATSTGDRYTFTGHTDSKSWPKNNLNGQNMVKLIDDLNTLPQTSVENLDDRVKITFNSLLFSPESWYLKETVKKHLDKIGKTLKGMGDINIKISGHTAIFGKKNGKYLQDLSIKRATAVADYLVENKYLDNYSIQVEGNGGDKPVDSNSTKAGRSRNRRVEIDILKN